MEEIDLSSGNAYDLKNDLADEETYDFIRATESRANIEMRKSLLESVLNLTKVVNVSVIVLVFLIFLVDTIGLFYYTLSTPRLITENVIMALIAGTVVQIVSMLVGINKNLFPEDKK